MRSTGAQQRISGPGIVCAFCLVLLASLRAGAQTPSALDPQPRSAPDASYFTRKPADPAKRHDVETWATLPFQKTSKPRKLTRPIVSLETERGPIVMELYPDEAPETVANFITLVKKGFYNGLTFHRIEDWVAQGGDPKGDGSGGPGYAIKNEPNKNLKHDRGAVGMANSGRDTGGSQFYIILRKPAPALDGGQYTLFGRVTAGQDIAEKLQKGDKITRATVQEPEGYKFGPTREAEPEFVVPATLPPDATNRRYKSTVRVRVEIAPSGTATAELKNKSGDRDVDAAVLEAVRLWKWKPALKNGDPVKSAREFEYDIATGSRRYN